MTLEADLAYQDANGVALELFVEALQFDVTTKIAFRGPQSIAITETVINKGSVGTIGWFIFKNLDPTNFVTIKNQSAGKAVAILKPNGGICLLYAGADMQSMVAIADTAACVIDKLIISA